MSTETGAARTRAGMDGELAEALVRSRRYFTGAETSEDLRSLHRKGGRQADEFYRDRWSHDKVVRSTHGVNCTGSCSWKVYVKDGIITWEAQQTDYPSVGPDRPEYEPRGCPRGAAFSWYTYSPTRVRYPYVRGVLLRICRPGLLGHHRQRQGDAPLPDGDHRAGPGRDRGGEHRRRRLRLPRDHLPLVPLDLLPPARPGPDDRHPGPLPAPRRQRPAALRRLALHPARPHAHGLTRPYIVYRSRGVRLGARAPHRGWERTG